MANRQTGFEENATDTERRLTNRITKLLREALELVNLCPHHDRQGIEGDSAFGLGTYGYINKALENTDSPESIDAWCKNGEWPHLPLAPPQLPIDWRCPSCATREASLDGSIVTCENGHVSN